MYAIRVVQKYSSKKCVATNGKKSQRTYASIFQNLYLNVPRVLGISYFFGLVMGYIHAHNDVFWTTLLLETCFDGNSISIKYFRNIINIFFIKIKNQIYDFCLSQNIEKRFSPPPPSARPPLDPCKELFTVTVDSTDSTDT